MKRTRLTLIVALLTGFFTHAQAQINDDYEIVFTDEEGQQEVIDLPEALWMESIDSLLDLFHSQKYLTLDDECEASEENPYYSDEVIAERLSRMPTRIEMPFNGIVRQFIDRYTSRMRRSVSAWLGSSNFYMPIFEEALDHYNVPMELKYLPVIESALNPKAV